MNLEGMLKEEHEVTTLMEFSKYYVGMSVDNYYGDGHTSEYVVSVLKDWLNKR